MRSARTPLTVVAVTVWAALLVACSGDDADTTGGPPATAAPAATADRATTTLPAPGVTSATVVGAPRVACNVTVTGALVSDFIAYDDRAAFSSDYYLSDAEIAAAALPTGDTTQSTVPGEESDLTPPPRPDGTAPLTAWFLLNCQGGDITVSLFSNPLATRRDVPFAAGAYPIAAGMSGSDDPQKFLAVVSFFNDPTLLFQVADGARLEIDRFDQRGAEGSFRIPMTEYLADPAASPDGPPRTLEISGTFLVACKRGANCRP